MRKFSLLTVLATTALSVSACGNSEDTGYLGSRDDIIVTNRNMPPPEPVAVPKMTPEQEAELSANGEIATLKQTTEDDAEAARIKAQEQAIAEAKAEALKPIEGRDTPKPEAEKVAATQTATETTAETKKPEFKPMKQGIVPASATQPPPAVEPAAVKATPTVPPAMETTEMIPPPEHRKPAPVETAAASPVPPVPADNSGDIPANAKPGECYAKVLIPAVTETKTERVLVAEEQEVLARIVPAKYEVKKEQVLVREARQYWKPGTGPKQKVDQTTGEILCLVEEPAVYKTVEKRVLIEPEKPEYKTIPAQYETVSKTVTIEPERLEWRRILCETNLTPGTIAKIQQALNAKGFDAGPIDGKPGNQTLKALTAYQKENGLASRGITYETINHLGVSLAGA
jgi:hypothetical protein